MSLDVRKISAQHTYGTWRKQKAWNPPHVVSAEGCFFTDSDGKRYLDMASQLICSNLGHGNRAVIEAIKKQAEEMPFVAPSYTTTARAELTQRLLEILPKNLDKFFFTTSGTEANEAAIKIARLYTGKHKIITRYSSYHGSTAGTQGLTGDFRRWPAEAVQSVVPGSLFAPDVNCYRCPIKHSYPTCNLACADYIEYMLEREGNVAAVMIEPIVGTNGIFVPPKDYLTRLRAITRKYGVLLIADEVMSGWGRTGTWFAVDHEGIEPDILCTAKGITSAYVPLGLTATSKEISKHFDEHFFAHGHTYEAHPMTLGPAVAAIDEYKRLGLLERARQMGGYMGRRLVELKDKHKSVGDVRGRGLFWAVELVKDRATKEPFNTMHDKAAGRPLLMDQVAGKMMQLGVPVLGWVSHLVLAPPLIITEAEIDLGIKALDEALAIADAAC